MQNRILVIDDEIEMLVSCHKILQTKNYEVTTAERGKQALHLMENNEYDLVLCDLKLPDIDGLTILKESKIISPGSILIFITAYGTVDMAVEAMKMGAFNFIEKPFTFDKLLDIVDQGLKYRDSITLDKPLKKETQFDNIIGKSLTMQRIYDVIKRIAPTDSNVMIIGESGTGKELVAQSIHNHSIRKEMAFVPVNCGALPEHIFESEVFGHEKGAFTGAHMRKIGLLEYATGGTFFLDEVCMLPAILQVKLLRMLQDKKIRRVGGDRLINVDVRIVSATNIDPEQALKDSILREDLYYRLKVITIKLPPLRERIDDIPLICNHFLTKYLKLNPSKKVKGITPETMILLQNYSWPGNVRELQNVIESSVALAKGEWISHEDLPENINNRKKLLKSLFKEPIKGAKDRLIATFEREYLINALTENEWNITKTANFCGINRRTIQRLIKKYQIDLQDSGNITAPETE